MQDVEDQPSPGVCHCLLPLTQRPATAREPLERARQLPPQALGLEKLPVVEGDAVAQPETGHEVVAVKLNGLGQQRHAFGTYLRFPVPVRLALCQEVVETDDVYQDRAVVKVHVLSVGDQPPLRAGLAQRREGPAQGGAGATLVVLGPEQSSERVPGVAPPRYGQVGGERDRLPRVDFHEHALVLDARRTEQRNRRSKQNPISRDSPTPLLCRYWGNIATVFV